ncbi:MAG: hypothetical protein KGV56_02230 [Gammaproteobacteria bacterium]|nr:hypothetical protein [Gammaproteobacteria bacterium]
MNIDEQTESNLLKFIRYFVVLLVAVALAVAVYYRLSHQKIKQTKETVAVQDETGQNDKQSKILPEDFSPSGDDMVNLAMAMHGAAGQQPDDAPKDKYGRAYIIGDLGGVPVNLPQSVVEFVEYDDSPGWNPEALRNYKPSVRSYQSIIESFGFFFRNHDKVLLDRDDHKINQQYEKRGNTFSPEEDWVDVNIKSGRRYPPPRWFG